MQDIKWARTLKNGKIHFTTIHSSGLQLLVVGREWYVYTMNDMQIGGGVAGGPGSACAAAETWVLGFVSVVAKKVAKMGVNELA